MNMSSKEDTESAYMTLIHCINSFINEAAPLLTQVPNENMENIGDGNDA